MSESILFILIGILLEEEKRILLDEDNPVTVTPRPLVVIECPFRI
jgi:hypothetical protein